MARTKATAQKKAKMWKRTVRYHLALAVAGRLGILVGGDRHADLGATDRAAVADLHLAELARGWRLGQRRRDRAQHREPHSEDEVGRPDGDEHADDGSHRNPA